MINRSEINSFNKDGVIKIQNIIDQKTILSIKNEYQNTLIKIKNKKTKLGKYFNFVKNPNKPSSLHRLEEDKNSLFYKIARRKIFKKISEKLLDSEARLQSIQFFIKHHKENLPTPIHQDNAYWCKKNGKGLSIWIALSETNKKKGCMYYYVNSHKKNYSHHSSKIPGSSLIIKKHPKKKLKFYKLKPGDCAIHDSKTIHGSFKNFSNRTRIAFIVCFVSKNSRTDNKLKKKYNNELKKQNINRLKKIN